jgi:FkbM family methyltransferase
MSRQLLRRGCNVIGGAFLRLGQAIFSSEMERRVIPWFAADGDRTLRMNYDLDSDSLVLDAGGYLGQWASDIFSRYCCRVIVFEPVERFARGIEERFRKNPRIHVERLGLSAATRSLEIEIAGDSSSVHRRSEKCTRETILLKAVDAYFKEAAIHEVHLFKINIEGGEYELLERLIETGLIQIVRDLQVQFHDFVPDAESRMTAIKSQLAKTHFLTYEFPFVWENWRRREVVSQDRP